MWSKNFKVILCLYNLPLSLTDCVSLGKSPEYLGPCFSSSVEREYDHAYLE